MSRKCLARSAAGIRLLGQTKRDNMRQNLGETRSFIGARHAFMSPDSHERTTLPGWPGCSITIVISPEMGAKFTEYFVDMPAGAVAVAQTPGVERFFFVLDGNVMLTIDGVVHAMSGEGFAFLPPGQWHTIQAEPAARLIVLERTYVPLEGTPHPAPVVSNAREIPTTSLKGDERLPLQKLLPESLSFDCEVNIMGFKPGASLPYVETHFMEHGLLLLDGGGIYRLDGSWYSVEAGDVIWMGPFCPQWFGAIGRENARYLIYKNWNRIPS
jgi:(S)-ureidoglycine aminohydrolase